MLLKINLGSKTLVTVCTIVLSLIALPPMDFQFTQSSLIVAIRLLANCWQVSYHSPGQLIFLVAIHIDYNVGVVVGKLVITLFALKSLLRT
jgi:hypothetical protein